MLPAFLRVQLHHLTSTSLWRTHPTHRRGKVSTLPHHLSVASIARRTADDVFARADSLPPLPSDVEGGQDAASPSQSNRNVSRNPASTPMSQARSFGGLVNSSVRMNANAGAGANRRASLSYSQSVCSSIMKCSCMTRWQSCWPQTSC